MDVVQIHVLNSVFKMHINLVDKNTGYGCR